MHPVLSLPPAIVSACHTSIEYLKISDKERNALHEKTIFLRNQLNEAGIPIMNSSETHILPILIGSSDKCKLSAERLLHNHNIYLQPINSPTVPQGTERFRINVTPNHTKEQILHLTNALVEVFQYYKISFTQ